MKSKFVWLAGFGLLLAGGVLTLWLLHKTVTLAVDGQTRMLRTFALTVGGLLQSESIALHPADALSPGLDHRLRDRDTITLERAVPVVVYADGETHSLLSAERRPDRLIQQAGITLRAEDELLSGGEVIDPTAGLARAQVHGLQVRRAVAFTFRSGGVEENLRSTAPTVGAALWQAGIVLVTADRLDPAPGTPLTEGLTVTLTRSSPVTIRTATGEVSLRSAADTVGEALLEAGLSLQGLDYTQPAAEASLPKDGVIHLVRVQESVVVEQTPLPFETETQAVDTLELDNQAVVQVGAYGSTAKRVRVRSEDGVEVSRQVEAEWVALAPQAQIIGYGTQIVAHTLDTPDGKIQYWRALQFWVTSYHPSEVGGSITASGKPVRKGLVGVDTHYISFGTLMYVPGYGYAEAADTGHITGRWLDLGYSDEEYVPWHQWVTVYFLWPPPAFVPWTIPPPNHY